MLFKYKTSVFVPSIRITTTRMSSWLNHVMQIKASSSPLSPISITMIASKILGCKVTSIELLLCRYDLNFAGVLEGGDQCNFCSKLPSKCNSQISSWHKWFSALNVPSERFLCGSWHLFLTSFHCFSVELREKLYHLHPRHKYRCCIWDYFNQKFLASLCRPDQKWELWHTHVILFCN